MYKEANKIKTLLAIQKVSLAAAKQKVVEKKRYASALSGVLVLNLHKGLQQYKDMEYG